jgi:protein SCO1/2
LRPVRAAAVILGAVLFLVSPVPAMSEANIVHQRVPDLELINHYNERGRFVSDFIGDKLAAITFTYTTCTTICPVLDGIFMRMQEKIAADLKRDAVLITISIDPETDIPERLKVHAEKLGAKPGWVFLTGNKDNMTKVLKGLEMFTPDILNHPPSVFIVDGRKGKWYRHYGFPSSKSIIASLQRLRDER